MIHTISNQSITREWRPKIEEIAAFSIRPQIASVLEAAADRALAVLEADASIPAAVEVVSLSDLTEVPTHIGSIRVAVIRDGFDGGDERHANSDQVLLSLRGSGETHVETDAGWRTDRYGGGGRALDDRWHVVPATVWHKSAAPGLGHCIAA